VTRQVLFAAGYPLAIAVLVRFRSVVRNRRWKSLAVHHVGMAAIISGWAIEGRVSAVALNSVWLAVSSLWYGTAGRKTR